MSRYQLFGNIGQIVAFLIGPLVKYLNHNKFLPELLLEEENNTFFFISIILTSINLTALILNLLTNRSKMNPLSRRSTIKEHFEIKSEQGHREMQSMAKNIENMEKVSSRSPRSKPSLVLFNNMDNKEDSLRKTSTLSSHLDSIMDKDEVMEEYSPKEFIDISKKNTTQNTEMKPEGRFMKINNDIIYTDHNDNNDQQDLHEHQDHHDHNEDEATFNNFNNFNQLEQGHNNQPEFHHNQRKPYQNLDNETKITTNIITHLEGIKSNRLIHSFTEDKIHKPQGLFNYIEPDRKTLDKSAFPEFHNREILTKRGSNDYITGKDKELSPKDNYDGLKDESLSSNKMSKNKALLNKMIQNQNASKISFIFTIIQLSEISLLNFFVIILLFPFGKISFQINPLYLSLSFLIYSLISHYVSKLIFKYSNRRPKLTKRTLKINIITCISSMFVLMFIVLFIPNEANYLVRIILTTLLFIIGMISLMNCLTCYNVLITRIDNPKMKEKINFYQTYVSSLIRGASSLYSIALILIILNSHSEYVMFLLPTSTSVFLSMIFFLIKHIK
jgi:hypothetical protein